MIPKARPKPKYGNIQTVTTLEHPRRSRSAGKIMMTVFWDENGVLLLDFLPHEETATGIYYSHLITKFLAAIEEKRRGKLTRGVLLLHDDAPIHKSNVVQRTDSKSQFEELNHPPYSPDLAPCDYFLFSHLKKDLRGRRFESDDELMSTVRFDATFNILQIWGP